MKNQNYTLYISTVWLITKFDYAINRRAKLSIHLRWLGKVVSVNHRHYRAIVESVLSIIELTI